jgi:spore maturation protein CgeB
MSANLHIRYFAHSLVSDWNHGNAHFLRGLLRELSCLGHDVRSYEALESWSLSNLIRQEPDCAVEAIDQFRAVFRDLDVRFYNNDSGFRNFIAEELRGSDVVIIHEWNEPAIVNQVLELKDKLGFATLFHDTHHRAYTSPRDILRLQLHKLDGVLAFGEAVRRIYTDGFGMPRAWTFHEAADTANFRPLDRPKTCDVVWIGNWGDEERTRELRDFLIEPARALPHRKFVVHGVRYPEAGVAALVEAGITFRGYLPNLNAPKAYSETFLTLHVPRRQYANGLSGIPTIRVFEALACGTPLLCSPWEDAEGLFRAGEDYVSISDTRSMIAETEHLLRDDAARHQLAVNGQQAIRTRHTCAHRAAELVEIIQELGR